MALGDVNLDGWLDAVVVTADATDNTVWLGDGEGGFTADAVLGTVASRSVALGDLNGDRAPDAVISVLGGADKVWLGDPDTGQWSETIDSSDGNLGSADYTEVALGDVDGNGTLDIVLTGLGGSGLLLNNGAGIFSSGPALPELGGAFDHLGLGDLDGDGELDLVLAGPESTHALLGDGAGSFRKTFRPIASSSVSSVAVGDLDGDGDADLALARAGVEPSEILLSDAFQLVWMEPAISGVVAPDVDVSARLNMAAADPSSLTFRVSDSAQGDLVRTITNDTSGPGGAATLLSSVDTAELVAGSTVTVTASSKITTDTGQALEGVTWQYRVAAETGGGAFVEGRTHFDLSGESFASVSGYFAGSDTLLDLAVATTGGPSVIWEGVDSNGDGTLDGFSRAAELPETDDTYGIATGDFDNDGFADLALANNNDVADAIYLGNNDGSWSLSQTLGTGRNTDVVSGDFDSDGDIDLFFTYVDTPNTLFLNDGGSFTATSQDLGSASSRAAAAGDVDNDGDLDLVVGRINALGVLLWLNDGSGQFEESSAGLLNQQGTVSLNFVNASDIALGDLNNDGFLDIFLVSATSFARAYLNTTTGSFVAMPVLNVNVNHARGVDLADINGDGNIDVVLARLEVSSGDFLDTPDSVFLGDGAGGLTQTASPLLPEGPSRHVLLRDLDRDGRVDAFVSYQGRPDAFFFNRAPLRLSSMTPDLSTSSNAVALDVSFVMVFDADIDPNVELAEGVRLFSTQRGLLSAQYSLSGDTITLNPDTDFLPGEELELVWTSWLRGVDGEGMTPAVKRFRAATAAGNFAFDAPTVLPARAGPAINMTLADVNGDGHLDLLTARGSLGDGDLWLGAGDGTLSLDPNFAVTVSSDVATGDLDGDGDVEVVYSAVGNDTRIFGWDGSELVPFGPQTTVSDLRLARSVALGDLDGDGDLDLVLGNLGPGPIAALNTLWFNDGSGQFEDSGQRLGNGATFDHALGDFDGDGDLDLVVANSASNGDPEDLVWFNNGKGIFDRSQVINAFSNSQNFNVETGDINNDGLVDIYLGVNNNRDHLFINTGSVPVTFDEYDGTSFGTYEAALGDTNGNGNLEMVLVFKNGFSKLWYFTFGNVLSLYTTQDLGAAPCRSAALGDLNGDGILDFVEGTDAGLGDHIYLGSTP